MIRKQILFHLFWCVVAIVFIAAYIALNDTIDKFYDNHFVSYFLCRCYQAVSGNVVTRYGTASILVMTSVLWTYKVKHETKIDLHTAVFWFIIAALTLYICLWDSHWEFVGLFGCISYAHLFIVASVWVIGFSIFCYIRQFFASNETVTNDEKTFNEDKDDKSFTTDFIADKYISSHINAYANELLERLRNTDIGNEAFAVGVAGNWGTGKTTFLKALKSELGTGFVSFEFTPWNCQSPASIIDDFFSKFRDVLSIHVDPFLSKPVSAYARHLNTINRMDPWWAFVRNVVLAHSEADTESLKQKIADSMRNSHKKIVVLIDDIDRLEQDELFEVLRLVRNTANLPNLLYVVTYDKDYVVNLLTNKGISSPDLYLEKIFNVEVMLPKVTRFELLDALYADLQRMITIEEVEKIKSSVVDLKLTYTICHLLKNYREVKRFARQFAMHYTFAQKNLKNDDFSTTELFLLELIRYSDFKTYSILRDDPSQILTWSKGTLPKCTALRKEIVQELASDYEGERKYDRYLLEVLKILFSESASKKSNSIAYGNNFTRYFTLGVEDSKFYQYELDTLLDSNEEEIKSSVNKWFKGEPDARRNIESLVFLLDLTDTEKLTISRWQNMFILIGELFECDFNKGSLLRILNRNLCDERIPDGDIKKMNTFLQKQLRVIFSNTDYAIQFSVMCKSHIHDKKILTSDDWIDLMKYIAEKYLKAAYPDAIDIMDKKSGLYRLINNAFEVHYIEDSYGYEQEYDTENYIWPIIMNHFRNHRSNQYERFDKFFTNELSDEEMFEGISQSEVDEAFRARVDDYFKTENFLSAYRKACFNDNVEDVYDSEKDRDCDPGLKTKENSPKNRKEQRPKSKTKLLRNGSYFGDNKKNGKK